MNDINRKIITSIKEIKNSITLIEIEISKLERDSIARGDSFDVVAGSIDNLENVEKLIGKVEGLKEALKIIKKNFSVQ